MKKKKLSEISVNAATLNSQPGSYYNFRPFGLGSNTNDNLPLVSDFNEIRLTGFYSGLQTATNTPTVGTAYTLLNIKRAAGFVFQLAFGTTSTNQNIYIRILDAGVWSVWKKITVA